MIIWIKHYTNASDTSQKLVRLLDEHGPLRYGEYWLMLEALGRRFEGSDKNDEIFISVHDAKARLRSKTDKKFFESLEIFSACGLLSFKKEKTFLKVVCPILFELQDKDSKYNRKRIVDNDSITTLEGEGEEEGKKNKIKKKNKSVGAIDDLNIDSLRTLLETVPHDTQMKWVEHYGKDLVIYELGKASIWLASNSNKPKKDVARFLGNWLINSGKVIPGKFSKAEHRVPEPSQGPVLTDRQIQLLKEAGQI